MGLDMTLTAKIWCRPFDFAAGDDRRTSMTTLLKESFPEFGKFRIGAVCAEVACWRKAYPIHRWLVRKLSIDDEAGNDRDECHVERCYLEELRDWCARSIAEAKEEEEDYREVLEETVDMLTEALRLPTRARFYYSWSF